MAASRTCVSPSISGHLADGSAKTPQCHGKQDRPDRHQNQERTPGDIEAGAAVQNGLAKFDEMSGGREQHDLLNDLRHAFTRGDAAGEHLQRQEHEDHQQANRGMLRAGVAM